jgi:hypothetical protein
VTPPPLSPGRLAELLEDAVRPVTAPPDALDRIRRGVRRRRRVHRTGAALLAVAVLISGGAVALAVTSGPGQSRLASSTTASGSQRLIASATPTSTSAEKALPPGAALAPPVAAPSAASSGDSEAKAGYPSVGRSASWDIDGDGRPDTATIVPLGNARTTSSFTLVIHMTLAGTQTVPFTATSMADMPPHGPVIVGGADAAQDGRAELFVLVDASCCTEFWTIFRLVDGHVRQMTLSGQPVRLAVGGSAVDNGGFSCNGPDLVTYAYHPGTTADTFLATRDTYRWSGATLVLAAQQQATIHGTSSDRALAAYTGVSCGDLPQYVSAR